MGYGLEWQYKRKCLNENRFQKPILFKLNPYDIYIRPGFFANVLRFQIKIVQLKERHTQAHNFLMACFSRVWTALLSLNMILHFTACQLMPLQCPDIKFLFSFFLQADEKHNLPRIWWAASIYYTILFCYLFPWSESWPAADLFFC